MPHMQKIDPIDELAGIDPATSVAALAPAVRIAVDADAIDGDTEVDSGERVRTTIESIELSRQHKGGL